MPVYLLDQRLAFPPPERADESGLLAIGGDLSPERLMLAYRMGVFPWYGEGQPILWHSPPWRMVLLPQQLHVGRTLRKFIRQERFDVRFDTAFDRVVEGCKRIERPGQDGTWITDEMRDAYVELHRRGHAHCVEAWSEGELVGGLYGVAAGGAFFGESMFSRATNASKVAFVALVRSLEALGYVLIDCQLYTGHLATFGAEEWPRSRFLGLLDRALRAKPRWVWPPND